MSQNELFHDACVIIEQAQRSAYQAVNETLIKRNWLLGMRIQHEVLKDQRAEYGEQVIIFLAKELTAKYKAGFTKTNLYNYIGFFEAWPNFFHAVSGKFLENTNIMNSLRSKTPIRLSWTHYRIILQETTADGRIWYENEAAKEMWSTRTLQRNVSSQYYHRLLQSQDKAVVRNEMKELTKPLQDKLEYFKSPVIAEFLGFKNYYIDLVFYNYHLRCFVLIDLKTTKLSYQDVGQMDMYVKMYDELVCPEGHNPTIGMLLCAETDEDVAHYSVLNSNDQLYAAKYLTYMPTQDELRREIEQQKEFFRLQNT